MIMNIETVFARSKIVSEKYWEFLTKSYLPKYLNPEQQTGTLCHKMKCPYITMCLLNWKAIFKVLFVYYLKM